jgi:hypothetical protein
MCIEIFFKNVSLLIDFFHLVHVQATVLEFLTIRLKDIWARDDKSDKDDKCNEKKVRAFINDVTERTRKGGTFVKLVSFLSNFDLI